MQRRLVSAEGDSDLMGRTPPVSAENGVERLALLDELDSLERQNDIRRPVKLVLGVFTVTLIRVLSGGSFEWLVAAVLSYVIFIALMVAPLKRLMRIGELRRQLDRAASEPATALLGSSGLQRGTEEGAADHR